MKFMFYNYFIETMGTQYSNNFPKIWCKALSITNLTYKLS